MFQIQSEIDGIWAAEHVGDIDTNRFGSRHEAESAIEELRRIGPDWANGEYRIVEVPNVP